MRRHAWGWGSHGISCTTALSSILRRDGAGRPVCTVCRCTLPVCLQGSWSCRTTIVIASSCGYSGPHVLTVAEQRLRGDPLAFRGNCLCPPPHTHAHTHHARTPDLIAATRPFTPPLALAAAAARQPAAVEEQQHPTRVLGTT